jgi:hypothetical protein
MWVGAALANANKAKEITVEMSIVSKIKQRRELEVKSGIGLFLY